MGKTICAWCGELLHDGLWPISHGICPACSASLLSDQKPNLGRYLDLLDGPVALVDGDATLLAANGNLRRLLNKESGELLDRKVGEVFACAHALLPGGCGQTTYCSHCVIRTSVTETLASGTSVIAAAATLSHASGDELTLRVNTERLGKAVFLRIDGLPGAGGKRAAD